MPTHSERRALPYAPRQLYDIVADIERYPEFLPWCMAARIRRREGDLIAADLVIGFRMFRERFTSRVTLHPEAPGGPRIEAVYADGPFRHLDSRWIFRPEGEGTEIDFHVDFSLRSALLQHAIESLFEEAVRRMVAAFEARAARLYGPAAATPRIGAVRG